MPRSLTNEQLADKLSENQVDRMVLDEAARRLREIELRQLLTAVEQVSAVHASPLIDDRTSELVEKAILPVAVSKRSSARLSSLAGRIMTGASYDRSDVLSLAACVLSQDEDATNAR